MLISETLHLNTDLTVHAYTVVGLKRIIGRGYLVIYLQSFFRVPCIHVARKSDHWTFNHAPSIIVITNSYTLFIPVLWATKGCCSHFTDKDLMPKEDSFLALGPHSLE